MNDIARDYRTMRLARLAGPAVAACIVAAFALGVLLGGVLS
jgi:hypothetical protein